MHVLIASVSRYSVPSGICRYADNLAASVSAFSEAQTTIAIGPWQQRYFREVFRATSHSKLVGVDIRNTPVSRNLWPISKLPEIARRLRADVVHLSYPVPFVRKLFPCPVVVTVHDLYPFDTSSNFSFAFANQQLFKLCVNQADAVVCISMETLRRLHQLFPQLARKQTATQIYNPIAIPQLAVAQQAVGGLEGKNFVLSVGQHRKNKNLDILQRAFAKLLLADELPPHCQLVVVGSEGPETNALHALTRELGLTKKVQYLSGIFESELAWLYRNCLIMATPSSNEGLCMPVIEALSSGCRVVCSDIPVLREVGSDACTYFPLQPDPVHSLASAIVGGLSSPLRSDIPNHRFGFDHVAQEFYGLYREVTGRTKAFHPEALEV